TATAGSDYAAAIGTVTFPAGVTTQTITIAVNGDTTYEYDETFFVNLASVSGATIADAQGLGTIRNDAADVAPTLDIISPAPVAEGTGGSTFIHLEVTLSAASGRPVTLKYATAGGTATSGVDFAPASGTLVFAPGQTSQFIPVSIVTDALNELDETFQVKLSKVVGAQSGLLAATGTITNDDALPSLSIANASIFEGDSGFRKMVFTVTLSAASGQTVLVNYATAPNTALTPADFITKTGTLTFAPGVTTQTLFILIRGDNTVEGDETFTVDLSVPTNATIAPGFGTGIGTIQDDD
ncbi:MAG: hypothetical protein NT031_18870, partial [Planctomycetota bacterium]|nr:hypothetical protein [Planctomycetota bacterium]